MAFVERASNQKEKDTRWGGNWRPWSILGGIGLGALGLGMGNMYSAYKFGHHQADMIDKSAKIFDKLKSAGMY